MTADEAMRLIDTLLSHVWMVRTFLKHSDEAAEDEQLAEVHRHLYDFMLALGPAWKQQDGELYLRMAGKKWGRLRRATDTFAEIQPEVSDHTNFRMAVQSLSAAVTQIEQILAASRTADTADTPTGHPGDSTPS